MRITRRRLLSGAAVLASSYGVEPVTARSRDGGQSPSPLTSKRTVANLNVLAWGQKNTYPLINHVLAADSWLSPVGNAMATTALTFNQVIDANGYPNNTMASTLPFGGNLGLPASSNFSGPYVLTWDGNGTLKFLGGSWTVTTPLSGKPSSSITSPQILVSSQTSALVYHSASPTSSCR